MDGLWWILTNSICHLNYFRDILDLGPGRGAWVANKADANPWIKVDLLDWYEVRGIITQVMLIDLLLFAVQTVTYGSGYIEEWLNYFSKYWDTLNLIYFIMQGRNGISQPVNQNDWIRKYTVDFKTHKNRDIWEMYKDTDGKQIVSL